MIKALFVYNYWISHFFNCVFNLPGGVDDTPEPVCRDDHDDHGGRVHGHGRGRLDNSAKTDGWTTKRPGNDEKQQIYFNNSVTFLVKSALQSEVRKR